MGWIVVGCSATGKSGHVTRDMTVGAAQVLVVRPNVRAKRATTAGRAGQQAQNGPKALRLMAGVACRWRSA